MSVGFPAHPLLRMWAHWVQETFDAMPYLVGSSVDKKGTRDVDVVVMLDEGQWRHWFGEMDPSHGDANPRWASICTAFSVWGKEQTGLNIDFKVQPIEWANERHKGPRCALLTIEPGKGGWTKERSR